MTYQVTVTADPNDADYQERTIDDIETEDIEFLRKIAAALNGFKKGKNRRHNWTRGLDIRPDWPECTEHTVAEKYAGILTEDDIQRFEEDYMPYDYDAEGMHTIIQIEIIQIGPSESLLI